MLTIWKEAVIAQVRDPINPMAKNVTPTPRSPSPTGPPKCLTHAWKRLPENNTPEDRIQELENDTSNVGNQYNACVARKYQAQGKMIDVACAFGATTAAPTRR